MAIADDWSIDTVNRIIKYIGTGATYTVNELYSWLMDTFDNPEYMDDPIPMSARTPTDYQLINQWFIPRDSFKYLKGGAIATADWNADTYNGGILKITFEEAGYTNAVESDIGKTVTGSVTGDFGTLLDYDNTHRIWWVRVWTAGTYAGVGETVSVSGGTGSGTVSATATGEWLWTNVYTLGAIRPDSIIYIYYGTYPFTTQYFPDGDKIEKWWGVGHIDVLIMVKEAGTLIRNGYITLFIREYGDLQSWYEIDLSAGGRNAAPLSTDIDISNTTDATTVIDYADIVMAQVCGKLNVTGETGTFQNYETVTGGTSGATGIVLYHNPDLHYLILGQVEGTFQDGETITGGTSGVTATVSGTLDVSVTTVNKDIGDGAGPQPYDICINCAGRHLSEVYEYLKYVTSRRFFNADKVFFYAGDTGTYTDETDDASFSNPDDATTMDDVLLPPQQTTATGDAIYIGGNKQFSAIQIYLTTPASYSDITLEWQYWNGTAWTTLTVTDESNGFTNTMEKVWEITFTPPADWATTTVNGVTAYWVRCVVTSFGASPTITTAPKASQIWVTYGSAWYLVQNDGTTNYTTYGECLKYAQSTYTPVTQCPFGQYLGGTFFGARGVWIENMHTDDVKNYQLKDSNNVTRYPPNIIAIVVQSCVEGDRVGVFRLTATGGDINKQRYQLGFSTIDKAFFYAADTATYTDETTDINNPTVDDVLLPPQQTTTSGDAIYFGSDYKFSKIRLNVSTAGVYSDITISWEYWNGTAWTTLTVTDGTSGFTVSGTNEVTFTPPTDWAKTTVNGVTMYWVRAVATLGTAPSITTAPLGAQGWHWFNYSGSNVVGVTTTIASDEPKSSTVRIVFTDGSEHIYNYQDWSKDKFILATGVTLTQDYTEGQYVYVPLLDKTVPTGETSVSNTLVYSADIPVIVRVRQKGYLPYELTTTVPSTGLAVTAIRTADTVVT
jgi:hypothetical protein